MNAPDVNACIWRSKLSSFSILFRMPLNNSQFSTGDTSGALLFGASTHKLGTKAGGSHESIAYRFAFRRDVRALDASPGASGSSEYKINDKATIVLPQGWLLRDQERDGLTVYLPLQRPLPKTQEREDGDNTDEDGNDKPKNVIDTEVRVRVSIEHRRDHAEAVRRLAEIAAAYPEKASTLLIGGWPAIERRRRGEIPQPDESENGADAEQTWFATTAVAVDATLYRLDVVLTPEADVKLLDQAQAVGRALRLPPGPADNSRREFARSRATVGPGA